jgi:hypothetical protein
MIRKTYPHTAVALPDAHLYTQPLLLHRPFESVVAAQLMEGARDDQHTLLRLLLLLLFCMLLVLMELPHLEWLLLLLLLLCDDVKAVPCIGASGG